MSVKMRLKRMGSKKKPFYRIVATDSRMPRDGRFIETLGYYNPMTEPPDIQVHEDVVFKWFERGATPSENVASLLRRVGCLQKWDLMQAGVAGEELNLKVEAIKNQQDAAAAKKQMKKKDAKTAKDGKDEEAKAEAPAAAESKAEEPKASEPEAEATKVTESEAEATKATEPEVEEPKAAEPAAGESTEEPEAK